MQPISGFLSIISLLGAGLALVLLVLLFGESRVRHIVARYSLWTALIVALGGVLASLYYSEVLRFAPCNLCWYQRAALYPQVILLGLALYYRDRNVMRYIAWLSGIGAVIAFYNHGLQMSWFSEGALCGLSATVSCAKIYVLKYGFVTIPFMSFVGFVINLLLALHVLRDKSRT